MGRSRSWADRLTLAGGLLIRLLIAVPWPLALAAFAPGYFAQWLASELAQIGKPASMLRTTWDYLAMLPGSPGWRSRWRCGRCARSVASSTSRATGCLAGNRRRLADPVRHLRRPQQFRALLLLPPLALLAAPGV